MIQYVHSNQPRRYVYPDLSYGETPHLMLPDENPAASNLARLLVKLGVDGRGPQTKRASVEEWLAGRPRLRTMRHAVEAAGFMVDVRFDNLDRSAPVRAQYTYKPDVAGLLVADRPPDTTGRMLRLGWVLGDGGVYGPVVPVSGDGEETLDLQAHATEYATLYSRTTDANSDSPLEVVWARLNVYQT